jgi:hypothetical protein
MQSAAGDKASSRFAPVSHVSKASAADVPRSRRAVRGTVPRGGRGHDAGPPSESATEASGKRAFRPAVHASNAAVRHDVRIGRAGPRPRTPCHTVQCGCSGPESPWSRLPAAINASAIKAAPSADVGCNLKISTAIVPCGGSPGHPSFSNTPPLTAACR